VASAHDRNSGWRAQDGKAVLWMLAALVAAAAVWWYAAPQTLPAVVKAALPASPNALPEVYKWHDAKGRLQITSTPPGDRPYETLRYDPKLNVVPSVTPPPAQP
jgi:uncharacterized protein DUF4124